MTPTLLTFRTVVKEGIADLHLTSNRNRGAPLAAADATGWPGHMNYSGMGARRVVRDSGTAAAARVGSNDLGAASHMPSDQKFEIRDRDYPTDDEHRRQ